MPDDSRVRSAPLGGWNNVLELLALIVDEIGLIAADKRREEPTHVIRPPREERTSRQRRGSTPQPPQPAPQQAPRMTGHRQMLMAAMQRGMIRSG